MRLSARRMLMLLSLKERLSRILTRGASLTCANFRSAPRQGQLARTQLTADRAGQDSPGPAILQTPIQVLSGAGIAIWQLPYGAVAIRPTMACSQNHRRLLANLIGGRGQWNVRLELWAVDQTAAPKLIARMAELVVEEHHGAG